MMAMASPTPNRRPPREDCTAKGMAIKHHDQILEG